MSPDTGRQRVHVLEVLGPEGVGVEVAADHSRPTVDSPFERVDDHGELVGPLVGPAVAVEVDRRHDHLCPAHLDSGDDRDPPPDPRLTPLRVVPVAPRSRRTTSGSTSGAAQVIAPP